MENNILKSGKYLNLADVLYVPRFMAQFGLLAKDQDSSEFIRRNHNFRVAIISPSDTGLPYGIYPRLILLWITTELKIKRQRDIYLGKSMNAFIRNLGKSSSGGEKGSLTSIQVQCHRLFSCYFNWEFSTKNFVNTRNMLIASEVSFLWDKEQIWDSYLRTSEEFFEHVQNHAYPVSKQTIKELGRNVFAMDVYLWLAYRLPLVRQQTLVTWELLATQFGNQYKRPSNFKRDFISACELVLQHYIDAKIVLLDKGIALYNSPPHISYFNSG